MILYYLEGFQQGDHHFISKVLSDKRGWAGHGYVFQQVRALKELGPTDVHVKLRSNKQVTKRFKHRSDLSGLSVTDIGTSPIQIWINKDNWNSVPINFVGDKECYRCYLIQHEFGHALGYDHVNPLKNKYQSCPVMYQQTRGTRDICKSNPWKLYEKGITDRLIK